MGVYWSEKMEGKLKTLEEIKREKQQQYDAEIAAIEKKIADIIANNTAVVEKQWMRVYNGLEVDCNIIDQLTDSPAPEDIRREEIYAVNQRHGVKGNEVVTDIFDPAYRIREEKGTVND